MPVELTIVETELSLGQTVAEVILESTSAPGPAGPGVPAGGTDGQVLTKTSATDYATAWEDPTGGGGGGAPLDATYLVTTADGDLTAEVVVGATPGGELGGTWASPTVDASHSGSTHAAVQAAAEATAAAALSAHLTDTADAHDASAISSMAAGNLAATDVQAALNELDSEKAATTHAHAGEDITSGTVADARIASTIARDSEVTSAVATHEADTTSVHGIADTSALALTANHPSNATFNDHSARHEDGGADEISIAGLDGTPTELTNHLNDATDAHDASAISVADVGGNFTGDDVEEVLEELFDAIGGGGGGGSVVLFDSTLGANAASIDSGAGGFATTHSVLEFIFIGRTTEAVVNSTCLVRFNNDSGNNYGFEVVQGNDVSATAGNAFSQSSLLVGVPGANAVANAPGVIESRIAGYGGTTFHKTGTLIAGDVDAGGGDCTIQIRAIRWASTTAISRVAVTAGAGNLLAGSRLIVLGR